MLLKRYGIRIPAKIENLIQMRETRRCRKTEGVVEMKIHVDRATGLAATPISRYSHGEGGKLSPTKESIMPEVI